MFEQATLSGGPLSTRLWSTCAGVTGQAILVGAALLVPLIWPSTLPQLRSMVNIVAPGPPPPPPGPGPTVRPRGSTQVPFQGTTHGIILPVRIPRFIARIEDDPMDLPAGGITVPGGIGSGIGSGGGSGSVLQSVLDAVRLTPPPPPAVSVVKPPPPPPAQPTRYRIGGLVKAPVILQRVEPVYPSVARAARAEGVVELEGVIGTDGRIHELRAKSGPILLVKAALEAVSKWIYTPGTLNGEPVEVIAPISVTFRLAR